MPKDIAMQPFDPSELATLPPEAVTSLSGLELFNKIIAGDLPHPPVSALSNQRMIEADIGRVVWETSPPENFVNPWGGVHGGWAMTVLDSALACAVHSGLAAGQGSTTLEVKSNLTRAPKVGEVYRCEGRMLSLGRRVGTAEARIIDSEDRIVAFASTTCLVFDLK